MTVKAGLVERFLLGCGIAIWEDAADDPQKLAGFVAGGIWAEGMADGKRGVTETGFASGEDAWHGLVSDKDIEWGAVVLEANVVLGLIGSDELGLEN